MLQGGRVLAQLTSELSELGKGELGLAIGFQRNAGVPRRLELEGLSEDLAHEIAIVLGVLGVGAHLGLVSGGSLGCVHIL